MVFGSAFDTLRRLLRLERQRQGLLACGCSSCKYQSNLVMWATHVAKHVSQLAFNHCERHSSSGRQTLTTTRIGIWLQIQEFKSCVYIYIGFHFDKTTSSILSSYFSEERKKKNNIFTSRPNLRTSTCDCCTFSHFVEMKGVFFLDLHNSVGFHIQVANVRMCWWKGSNYPQHQGWYKSFQFIGIHPHVISG